MENRSALVAYATETGNAYDYAEELGRILERIRFCTDVLKLNESSLKKYFIVIIVVSTTGQGDLPINARLFWKSLLRKRLPPTYLNGVKLSSFGLGDSSYPKFNWAARKLHKRLLQLGANEIYPRGEADEQHDEGLDASFVPWSSDLRNNLLDNYPLPNGIEPIPEKELLRPKWQLSLSSQAANGHHLESNLISDTKQHPEPPERLHGTADEDSTSQKLAVTLEENHRMTPLSHLQDVRHMVFVSKSQATYGPGDVLTIQPKNPVDDVHQLIERMDWTDVADQPIQFTYDQAIKEGNVPSPPPVRLDDTTTTLRTLLTVHLDITAIPRRSFFSLIAHFTSDPFQKDRLLEFTDPMYVDELYDYTTRPRRSILEVLQEFESVKIPWQWAASVLPELRGRQFSIASGGTLKKSPEGNVQFELLVAIVKYKTVIKKVREGVCTRYLAALPPGTELNVTLQKGGLAVKENDFRRPMLMIGPGTGVAPMRSLIWERLQWIQETKPTINAGMHEQINGTATHNNDLLFFGCRNETADYFYRHEWDLLTNKTPLKVHTAFSRDQTQKIYVQDLIRRESASVYALICEANGLVYVCGSSGKMPQAVRASLADAFMKHGNMDRETANRYLEGMEKEGRYKQETW